MSDLVTLTKTGDIAVVTINNPPVNALSPGVPEGVLRSVEAANADPEVRAIVVIGAGNTFVAGADISEFGKIVAGKAPPVSLAQLFLKLEDSAKPLIMALHGTAFGGGLELAMAGHYRVIAPWRAGWPAGSKARCDSGRSRHPAVAPTRRHSKGGGNVRVR